MASIQVAITKGGGKLEIDLEKIPDNVYQAALAEGLKSFLNRKMTKISVKGLEGEELAKAQAAAMDVGAKNLEELMAGKLRVVGAKAAKASGAVMTEARRLARQIIKDGMKREGIKVSHVAAKDITAAANVLLGEMPELIEQAKASVEATEAKSKSVAEALLKTIPTDPKKVAAAEKAAAEKKAQLSAKQAGKPKARAKGDKAGAQASA